MAGAQEWQADLDLICDAARRAGDVALTYFKKSPEVWWKGEGHSPVSAADFAANDVLANLLQAARPDYGWLSEETEDNAARLGKPTLFVVDPIDGTRGFLAGHERWCVSVAVVDRNRPVAAVLYAPALQELYVALHGGDALKNGSRIRASRSSAEQTQRVASSEDMLKGFDPDFRDQVKRVEHVPSLAYRLAMVADGRLESTLVKRNSHDWDLAAADLILDCAGGALVDLSGERLRYNRESVRHGELCGAAADSLDGFLQQLSQRSQS